MKILYDQQIFSFQEYGGISRYYYELIRRINKSNNGVFIDGRFSNNIFLAKLKKNVIKLLPAINFPHKNIILFYLNCLFDCKNLKKSNFDIFHVTYFHPYFLNKLNGKPYIITVYDMVPELFTNDFKGVSGKTLKYKKETIVKANHIITISENTKKDLVSLYKIPKDKISVIYLGNPLENAIPDKVENLPKRYLLFVGNRQGYKNFVFFIKSIAPILNENGTLFLVCTGGGIFSTEEKALFSKLNITNQIKQINFENDNELAYIYKNAIIYILPSLYEGFGMTVLEAFSMGCPVVASNISSIPEVCEKAALYIDPKNTNSIRRGIEKIMNDKEIRKRLVKSGFEQVKKFSWCVTVNKTLKTYKNLIGK